MVVSEMGEMWSPYTAPGQRRAHSHEEQRIVGCEHADNDGQNKGDGTPARTHGETDEGRHYENDGRQKVETHAQAIQEAGNELAGAQEVAAASSRATRPARGS